jgi:pilus assembly protein Flp/PilA
MQYVTQMLRALKIDDRGVTAIEYAMIAALVAVAAATAMTTLSGKLSSTLSVIGSAL